MARITETARTLSKQKELTKITCDDEREFEGRLFVNANTGQPITWNGWLCPCFTLEVAREIVAFYNEANKGESPPIEERTDALGRAYFYDLSCGEEWHVDADGEYALGAWAWTWGQLFEEDEEEDAERCDDCERSNGPGAPCTCREG